MTAHGRFGGVSLAALCLGVAVLSACASSTADAGKRPVGSTSGAATPSAQAPDAAGFYPLISAAGTWRVSWRTEPSPIPLNEPFSVFVRVARSGNPTYLPDIPVRVDAGMPQHQHGMNRVPEQVRVEPGLLRADGLLFHMAGAWTLTFDVTDGAITERAEVVVEVP